MKWKLVKIHTEKTSNTEAEEFNRSFNSEENTEAPI